MECLRNISLQECSFSIPAAARSLCSIVLPLKLHPLHETLQEEIYEWAKANLGHVLSQEELKKIHADNYGWLGCSFWPHSTDPRRSLTLLKLMLWFIVFDDAIDNSVSMCRDAHAVHNYCILLLQTLFGNARRTTTAQLLYLPAPPHPDSRNEIEQKQYSERELLPFTLGLDWWGDMKRNGMPIKQQARFAAAITDYVMSQVSITNFNKLMDAETPPALHDFIPVRRVAVGAPLCFLASEYDLGIELDDETLHDPLVKELHKAVSDQVAWLNDILSFPKEFAKGEFLNLICLLHIHNNSALSQITPFSVAAAQAWDMTDARQHECVEVIDQIMEAPHLASKPNMQRYVDAVCCISSGNWAWSLNCSRYNAEPTAFDPSMSTRSLGLPDAIMINGSSCPSDSMKYKLTRAASKNLIIHDTHISSIPPVGKLLVCKMRNLSKPTFMKSTLLRLAHSPACLIHPQGRVIQKQYCQSHALSLT